MNKTLISAFALLLGLTFDSSTQAQQRYAASGAPDTAPAGSSSSTADLVQDSPQQREDRERRGIAVAAKASTLGLGLEGIYSISRHFNVRGQANFLNFSHTLEKSGNDYEGKIKLLTFGLLGDFYPFARVPVIGDFRLTAGALSNRNRVELDANCDKGCSADNLTITSAGSDPAHLTGGLKVKNFSPYAGFGFGNAMQGGPWHFAFDLGVLFQGRPKVNLQASGTAIVTDQSTGACNISDPLCTPESIDNNSMVQTNVANEQQRLQNDVKNYRFYPVVSFTVGYRFSFL